MVAPSVCSAPPPRVSVLAVMVPPTSWVSLPPSLISSLSSPSVPPLCCVVPATSRLLSFAATVPPLCSSSPSFEAVSVPFSIFAFDVTSSAATVPACCVRFPVSNGVVSLLPSPATSTSPVIDVVAVMVPPSWSTVAAMVLASTVPPSTSSVPAVMPSAVTVPVLVSFLPVASIVVAPNVPATEESAPSVSVEADTSAPALCSKPPVKVTESVVAPSLPPVCVVSPETVRLPSFADTWPALCSSAPLTVFAVVVPSSTFNVSAVMVSAVTAPVLLSFLPVASSVVAVTVPATLESLFNVSVCTVIAPAVCVSAPSNVIVSLSSPSVPPLCCVVPVTSRLLSFAATVPPLWERLPVSLPAVTEPSVTVRSLVRVMASASMVPADSMLEALTFIAVREPSETSVSASLNFASPADAVAVPPRVTEEAVTLISPAEAETSPSVRTLALASVTLVPLAATVPSNLLAVLLATISPPVACNEVVPATVAAPSIEIPPLVAVSTTLFADQAWSPEMLPAVSVRSFACTAPSLSSFAAARFTFPPAFKVTVSPNELASFSARMSPVAVMSVVPPMVTTPCKSMFPADAFIVAPSVTVTLRNVISAASTFMVSAL